MNPRWVRAVVVAVALMATLLGARPAGRDDPVAWSAPMHDGPWDLAADARGVVVVTQRPGVRALDRHGHEQWSAEVDGLVEAAPALDGDVVLVGGEGAVTALARRDGARRWRRPMGGDVHAVAVAGDVALAGDRTGTLTAFDVRTADVRWSVQFPGALWSAPRVDRATGSVVASWHQTDVPAVRALDLSTGALRWEAPTGACSAAPAMRAELVVLAIGDCSRHARVEGRDLASGARRWQVVVPASFEEAIEPAIDGQGVAVVDHFGVVTLIDPTTGHVRWRHDLARPLLATRMGLSARRVVFSDFSGTVFVLDRADGRVVSRLGARRLGGYPVALRQVPWRGRPRLLTALRYDAWRVDLRTIP
jgi:outer membrane protein assembly factor BamB